MSADEIAGLDVPPSEASYAPQRLSQTSGTDAEEGSESQGLMENSTEMQEDSENGHSTSPSPESGLSTPNASVTCQPQAQSTPLVPPPDGPSDSSGPLQNGVPPPQLNGVRNGGTRAPQTTGRPPQRPTSSQKNLRKLQSNPSITSHMSKKSKTSSKSGGSQIPNEARDDCCVHCILACLFCEFLTLCNVVLDCALCGSCGSADACLCCCCASEECGDCDLPCDMDCGIIDACCESADCLEICMECCGLCFSS